MPSTMATQDDSLGDTNCDRHANADGEASMFRAPTARFDTLGDGELWAICLSRPRDGFHSRVLAGEAPRTFRALDPELIDGATAAMMSVPTFDPQGVRCE